MKYTIYIEEKNRWKILLPIYRKLNSLKKKPNKWKKNSSSILYQFRVNCTTCYILLKIFRSNLEHLTHWSNNRLLQSFKEVNLYFGSSISLSVSRFRYVTVQLIILSGNLKWWLKNFPSESEHRKNKLFANEYSFTFYSY